MTERAQVRHTPNTEELLSIAEMVWASYLDPAGDHPLVVDADTWPGVAATDVVATVAISGAWDGRVLLSFTPLAAKRAAAALLGLEDAQDMGDADVADAVGELANIIGGSVKSLMSQPTVLSLPAVHTGPFPDMGGEVCRVSGTWRGEAVSVAVHEVAAYVGVSRTGETSQ
jgi:chemotaxis protein CheX